MRANRVPPSIAIHGRTGSGAWHLRSPGSKSPPPPHSDNAREPAPLESPAPSLDRFSAVPALRFFVFRAANWCAPACLCGRRPNSMAWNVCCLRWSSSASRQRISRLCRKSYSHLWQRPRYPALSPQAKRSRTPAMQRKRISNRGTFSA